MLLCWKYEPSERPTFFQLEKALSDVEELFKLFFLLFCFLKIELKQVRWKDHNKSINITDGFLPIESCLLGPLIILDRWYVHNHV